MAKILQISKLTPQNFEEILEALGGFGRFQVLILFLLLFFEIPVAFTILINIFTGYSPREWECNGELVDTVGACGCNGTISAPLTSIVAEWNLICDYAWVSDCITSIQMAGMLFGNLYASQIADWYGRRYTTFAIILILGLASCVSAVAPNPYVYAGARFICGAGFSSYFSITAIYTMEFMPMKWRMLCGSVGPFGEGTMLLAVLAYFIPQWRTLTWITATPYFLIVLFFPFIPESPRWLLQKGRFEEFSKVLAYMAKVNKQSEINEDVLKKIVDKECPPMAENEETKSKTPSRFTYFDFFKSKNSDLRLKTICIMAIFIAWSLIYFGLSFNIKNIPGNLYLNVVYLGITDSIGFPSALFIINRFGRRLSVIMSMSLGAFFLVILAIFQLTIDVIKFSTLALITVLLGKFCVSAARSALRAMSGESFPTSVRGMGAGLCGVSASIGAVIGSQLVYLGTTNPAIPFFAFAVFSVAGSLFTLLMPETKGQPLQESVGRKRSRAFSIISTISDLILSKPNTKGEEKTVV